MGRKKLFSLIEIAVAMAVAAIGVAAIMALLPVAVKSTSDSVGDTLATDVAYAVFARLDRAIWSNDGFKAIQGFHDGKPGGTDFSQTEVDEYINKELEKDKDGAAIKDPVSSYLFKPENGLFTEGKCVFIFGAPGQKPDFVAEVICWREKTNSLDLTTLDPAKGTPQKVSMNDIKYEGTGNSGDPFVRVYVEVSWPISKPYSKNTRQSRLFVREYLDPAYYKTVK